MAAMFYSKILYFFLHFKVIGTGPVEVHMYMCAFQTFDKLNLPCIERMVSLALFICPCLSQVNMSDLLQGL